MAPNAGSQMGHLGLISQMRDEMGEARTDHLEQLTSSQQLMQQIIQKQYKKHLKYSNKDDSIQFLGPNTSNMTSSSFESTHNQQ